MNTNITTRLWSAKNPTLSEFLTRLVQGSDNIAISNFVGSRSTLLLENVDFGVSYSEGIRHLKVSWMQIFSSDVWVAAQDNNRGWWIGIWDQKSGKFNLSPTTCHFSSIPQKLDFAMTILDSCTSAAGGLICVHPMRKSPILPYYKEHLDDSKHQTPNTITIYFAEWNGSGWKKCMDLDPIELILPPTQTARYPRGPETATSAAA